MDYIALGNTHATVRFDDYLVSTITKDSAHTRRGLKLSPDVEITPDTYLDEKKGSFLSNKNN